jgi:hypothetical protein
MFELKKKTKGRNKPSKRAKRKQEEVFNAKRPFLEKQKEAEGAPQEKKEEYFWKLQRISEVSTAVC